MITLTIKDKKGVTKTLRKYLSTLDPDFEQDVSRETFQMLPEDTLTITKKEKTYEEESL